MAYAIIRAKKLTTGGQMGGMQRHNDRSNEVKNVDGDLTHLNYNYSKYGTNNILKDVNSRLKEADVKVRTNSVRCIEYLITASPEAFSRLEKYKKEDASFSVKGEDASKWGNFQKTALQFLKKKHGSENIVNISIHLDEKTPHIHAYVTPIVEKEVKWKNQKGEGIRKENRLSARDFLGGKDKLQQLQDDFAKSVEHLKLERGQKGSVAHHQTVQKFYGQLEQGERQLENKKLEPDNIKLTKPSTLDLATIDKWLENEQKRINEELQNNFQTNQKTFTELKNLATGTIQANKEADQSKKVISTQVSKANFYKDLTLGLSEVHPQGKSYTPTQVKQFLTEKGYVKIPQKEEKKTEKQANKTISQATKIDEETSKKNLKKKSLGR